MAPNAENFEFSATLLQSSVGSWANFALADVIKQEKGFFCEILTERWVF